MKEESDARHSWRVIEGQSRDWRSRRYPLAITLKNGSTTEESFGYTYGPSANVLAEADTGVGMTGTVSCAGSSETTCDTFDQAGRLGTATTASNTQTYASNSDDDSAALPQTSGLSAEWWEAPPGFALAENASSTKD